MEHSLHPRDSGMKECYTHTDLEWRLSQIPDHAAVRGVFLNMLDDRAKEFGIEVSNEYRSFFKLCRFSALRMYPVKDYLVRLVKLAQIRFGGPNIYSGIFQIQERAFPSWKETLMGRAGFAIVGSDLERVLQIMCRTTSNAQNYGRAELVVDQASTHVKFSEEYVYIQYAMAGAVKGVANACGLQVKIAVEMHDHFNGTVSVNRIQTQAARSLT
jgi:uncharacterized protein (TIGR02265 family)